MSHRQLVSPGFWILLLMASVLGAAEISQDTGSSTEVPDSMQWTRDRTKEFEQIPLSRRQQLGQIAEDLGDELRQGDVALIFICTHNSRRSQFAQVWAALAAEFYRVPGVQTFSGGTETTACNPRTVAALRRSGLTIDPPPDVTTNSNPVYRVSRGTDGWQLECFSKVYSDPVNPRSEFWAVLTCSDADRNCPRVEGAARRISLPYDDPKVSDDTPAEAARYDERCRQIAREMLYLFSRVRVMPAG